MKRALAHWFRLVLAGATVAITACSAAEDPNRSAEQLGSIDLELQIAPGVTIDTIDWTIANESTDFLRSGSVDVQFANVARFQVGGLPPATGYTVTLSALTTDGTLSCSGMRTMDIEAGEVTTVEVHMICVPATSDSGSAIIEGTSEICADIESISVFPLATSLNSPIELVAEVSAGALTPTLNWTAPAGTFDDPTSPTPIFTCPDTPGDIEITLTASPGSEACETTLMRSVVVTCEELAPTFTNVYANVISQRCVSCHRPGGSGVNAGMLDMSTQAVAYASLVGVPAQGTSAGASGVTCASTQLVRVVANDATNSLLFDKVNSKLLGVNPACGSGMPLGSAPPLTAAQVALIEAWIDAGALDD
ncbi:MAG TPA: hypothetical protein VKY73_19310 [Polyangiaceae bacterium]|nr:hypothetical protein [Polyangiaceae bacterium]